MSQTRRTKVPNFILSLYGWTYWMPVLLAGIAGVAVFWLLPGMGWLAVVWAILTLAVLAFYRDFPRPIPQDPGVMVAPADGVVTEITRIEHYEPLGGPALRLGIFLSVLDVHVNRSPCAGVVLWTRYEEGLFLDARHPESGIKNQSNTICLGQAQAASHQPVAVVKQIVGAIARRIIAPLSPGDVLARGERFGMIAFGSRTELYVPANRWEAAVRVGQHVKGGSVIVLREIR